MNLAIEVDALQKSFGEIEAVRGVSFAVARGEVFGFLGPNGAGKTTTINMLCTLARPTGGSALVAGHDVVHERDDVRRNIGLVFQDPTLDGYLTARQNLQLHAELYGVQSQLIEPRMQQVLEMVDLWDRRDGVVATFSGVMSACFAYGLAAFALPPVLFYRTVTRVLQKGRHRRELVQSVPLLLLFVSSWALGEVVGYWTGPGDSLSRVC